MRRWLALILLGLVGCAARAGTGTVRASEAPSAAPREELAWATFSPETFARARAEHKLVILDGSAEWCHWCHVMEATTYHDPVVRRVLDERFIAVKVDIDTRPDLAERYGDYGWPATVLFSPEAVEIGKYRGYIAPEKFAEILRTASLDTAEATASSVGLSRPAADRPLAEETLAWIGSFTEAELDDYWDEDQGGWGKNQKAPVGCDNLWMLERGFGRGDLEARRRALFALDQQSKLLDPVWGGIYQYSAASDWDHAHFEKLMTFEAPALESYAVAYRYTHDAKQLARARSVLDYVDRFLRGPDGGFYTTQDADLNAHDRARPFLDGHAYYALGEQRRLALGVPRVDTNEYGRENGLAIAAYVAMFEATADPGVLARAKEAALHIGKTHHTGRGGIGHAAAKEEPKQLFLADNAAFGWGLVRLHDADPGGPWLASARAIGDFLLAELADPSGGGLFATTADPDAVGIFAVRRVPFEENVVALRLLARLARATKDARYTHQIARILRAISVPEELKARGRWLGDYLLALEETRDVR